MAEVGRIGPSRACATALITGVVLACSVGLASADAPGGPSAQSDDRCRGERVVPIYDGAGYYYCRNKGFIFGSRPTPDPTHATHAFVEAGFQWVRDANGATAVAARLMRRGLGIAVSAARYEPPDNWIMSAPQAAGMTPPNTALDMWSAMIVANVLGDRTTQLRVGGGAAGLVADTFGDHIGAAFGVDLEHGIGLLGLTVRGSARYLALDRDLRATETRVGVRASVLTVGWKRIDIGEGVTLQGPEAGIAFDF